MAPSGPHTADVSVLHGIDAIFEIDSPLVRLAEPHFAALGKRVRLTGVRLITTWIRLALGDGTAEKIFAVLLGYAVIGLLLALYLNILTVGNVKSAGRAVRGAVRQQLLVVKVRQLILSQPFSYDGLFRSPCLSSSSSLCFP
jgi:E3 ubiquitin-protein ligase MARCH6